MNYAILERDFIERTLALIDQYDDLTGAFEKEDKFDHTLFLNCLLGLIVVPHSAHYTFLPRDKQFSNWGLNKSRIHDPQVLDTRELVMKLRHSVAHFSFEVHGHVWIERIVFKNTDGTTIIDFEESEMKSFLKTLGQALLVNIDKYKYAIQSSNDSMI